MACFKAHRHLLNYQRGLSIVEVMAAATLLAVIAAGAASFVPSAFRANQDARDLTASTQAMNGVMEILNTMDFTNISPYPFTTEPIYTPSNPVAVIDTTNRHANSPVTVCLERVAGSNTCASGKTMSFPYKYSLNKKDYRVDLVVYKGKHAYLVALPTDILDRFALASLPGFLLEQGMFSLSELLVPPAEAGGASSCVATPVTSVEAGTVATFTATNTYPSTPEVRWTFQDTPAISVVDSTPPFSTTKIWTIPGTYQVIVEAWKSSNGSSNPCSGSPFNVTVTPPAPVNFDVLPGLNSFVGVPFSFSVNPSLCPGCTPANTTWEMPGCSPATGTGLSASCSYPAAGSYTVLLKRNGATVGTKTISIGTTTVNITAPTTTTHAAGQTINFAATCSNCGPSPIFDWNFGDGNTQTNSQTASHSYATLGAYTPQVTVRDGSVNPPPTIGYATLPLTITSGTSVSLGVTPTSGVAGPVGNPNTTEFVFQTASTGFSGAPNNPTNAPVTYDIWYGDGNPANQDPDESIQDTNPADSQFPQFTHKYTSCGVYIATVRATVGATTATATQTVNTSAQASISASATTIQAGQSVTFTGSTIGGGSSPGTYQWTFNDDNSTQSGQTVTKIFINPGTYTVTLNVTGGYTPGGNPQACNPSATSQITVLPDSNSVAANQSYMKKIIVKIAPWSESPPAARDYLGSAVFFKANND